MNFFQQYKLFIVGGCAVLGAVTIFIFYRGATLQSISSLVEETFLSSNGVIVAEEFTIEEKRADIHKNNEGAVSASLIGTTFSKAVEVPLCEKVGIPSRSILINEVAWAGTDSKNTSHEWIELFNSSANTISLNGWQLVNSDASIRIIFYNSDKIEPQSYYLLERKDDETVPNISADAIFSGTIRNSDESLTLFDNTCTVIDEVVAAPQWPGGEASPGYRTLERTGDLRWQTYGGSARNGIFGTPRAKNSAPTVTLSIPAPTPVPTIYTQPETIQTPSSQPQESQPTTTLTPPQEQTGTSRVLISEIMVGSDGNATNEFIELYNAGDAQADMTGWSIKKKTSTGTEGSLVTATRLEGKSIAVGKYFLIANDSGYTGGTAPDVTWAKLNTLAYTSNSIVIYDNLGNIVEEVHWDEIPKDQSFTRTSWEGNSFSVSATPTPQNSGN